MAYLKIVIILLLPLLFSACATITSEEMQAVSVATKTNTGEKVLEADCSLKNDKGSWKMKTPGFVNVHRSSEDLIVNCKKEDLPDGHLRAISRAAGGMFGNIIFGGGIGAIIDHNKGTGYDYPYDLPVIMGESIKVDKKDENTTDSYETDDSFDQSYETHNTIKQSYETDNTIEQQAYLEELSKKKNVFKQELLLAKCGDNDAQISVAVSYHHGAGVEQDYLKAASWYFIAAAKGNTFAQQSLKQLSHNLTQKLMTEAQEKSPQLLSSSEICNTLDENN